MLTRKDNWSLGFEVTIGDNDNNNSAKETAEIPLPIAKLNA